ncbi:MAG TPA: hypothetical protein VNM47_01800 [Terriglobia bacterium]|nr:hypothetical protein [Terriglobia bacterium]
MKFQYGAMEDISGFVLASGSYLATCEMGATTIAVGQQRAAHTPD